MALPTHRRSLAPRDHPSARTELWAQTHRTGSAATLTRMKRLTVGTFYSSGPQGSGRYSSIRVSNVNTAGTHEKSRNLPCKPRCLKVYTSCAQLGKLSNNLRHRRRSGYGSQRMAAEKSVDVHLRVKPETKQSWEAAAKRERRSLSNWLTEAADWRRDNWHLFVPQVSVSRSVADSPPAPPLTAPTPAQSSTKKKPDRPKRR